MTEASGHRPALDAAWFEASQLRPSPDATWLKTTVLTIGTFDLAHPGHYFLFQQCRKLAGEFGRVVVGLNLDAFVASFKTRPPIQTYDERETVLRACRWVDDVIENAGGADARPCIEAVAPDWLVIGSDWCRDGSADQYYHQLNITADWLDQHQIGLLFVPRRGAMSTTTLKTRVKERP